MAGIKVIITGATGMVGEGVLFECLENTAVAEVLIVNRKHYDKQHPKLKELIVPDFFQLDQYAASISGYDACFFCAGISSIGMKEDEFRHITYDTTLAFAQSLLKVNSNMVFTYVSGANTDINKKAMWKRVKGKTEKDLAALPFKAAYNFRPGGMYPFDGQQNWKPAYKLIVKIIRVFAPKSILTMQQVGRAMIHAVTKGYNKNILEVPDIRALAEE